MLLYPPLKEMLEKVPSRYMLVNLVAARARRLSSQAEQDREPLEEKAVSLAIHEVADGELTLESAQAELEARQAQASQTQEAS